MDFVPIFALVKISRLIASFFLITLIFYNSLRISLTYAYYYLDMADFIERLCENKDKPELQCNGKCHLKKVTQTDTNDKQTPSKIIDLKRIVLFVENPSKHEFKNGSMDETRFVNYTNLYTYTAVYKHYHPPKA